MVVRARVLLIVLSYLTFAVADDLSDAVSFSSQNGQILANGRPFYIKGVNWYGLEGTEYALGGLDVSTVDQILEIVSVNGFNAVRIPVSVKSIFYNPNPIETIQTLEDIIVAAKSQNLAVVLAMSGFDGTPDGSTSSGLWYNDDYPEQLLQTAWETLSDRLCGLWNVIGADLWNEPSGTSTWGTGNQDTDWNLAAGRLGNAILLSCPEWLIFVQGVAGNNAFPGGNFAGLNTASVNLVDSTRLVFAPHVFGPAVMPQTYFQASTFPANLDAVWNAGFGWIPASTSKAVVVSEWGSFYDIADINGGLIYPKEKQFADQFSQWLSDNSIGGFYSALNPTYVRSGGLFNLDWSGMDPSKLFMLSVIPGTSLLSVRAAITATATPFPERVSIDEGNVDNQYFSNGVCTQSVSFEITSRVPEPLTGGQNFVCYIPPPMYLGVPNQFGYLTTAKLGARGYIPVNNAGSNLPSIGSKTKFSLQVRCQGTCPCALGPQCALKVNQLPPTVTPDYTPTVSPTDLPSPTVSPTSPPSGTALPTWYGPTVTPSRTFSRTPSKTRTPSRTFTATPTNTDTPTNTPTLGPVWSLKMRMQSSYPDVSVSICTMLYQLEVQNLGDIPIMAELENLPKIVCTIPRSAGLQDVGNYNYNADVNAGANGPILMEMNLDLPAKRQTGNLGFKITCGGTKTCPCAQTPQCVPLSQWTTPTKTPSRSPTMGDTPTPNPSETPTEGPTPTDSPSPTPTRRPTIRPDFVQRTPPIIAVITGTPLPTFDFDIRRTNTATRMGVLFEYSQTPTPSRLPSQTPTPTPLPLPTFEKPQVKGGAAIVSGQMSAAFGDPHFVTFDGVVISDISCGDSLLARSTDGGFMYQTRACAMQVNGNYSGGSYICAAAIQCFFGADIASFVPNAGDGAPTFYINGQPVNSRVNVTTKHKNVAVTLSKSGGPYFVQCDDNAQFEIHNRVALRGNYLDVAMGLPSKYNKRVNGLLGTWNGVPSDDVPRGATLMDGSDLPSPLDLNIYSGSILRGTNDEWALTYQNSLFGANPALYPDPCPVTAGGQIITRISPPPFDRQVTLEGRSLCTSIGVSGSLTASCVWDYAVSGGDVNYVLNAAKTASIILPAPVVPVPETPIPEPKTVQPSSSSGVSPIIIGVAVACGAFVLCVVGVIVAAKNRQWRRNRYKAAFAQNAAKAAANQDKLQYDEPDMDDGQQSVAPTDYRSEAGDVYYDDKGGYYDSEGGYFDPDGHYYPATDSARHTPYQLGMTPRGGGSRHGTPTQHSRPIDPFALPPAISLQRPHSPAPRGLQQQQLEQHQQQLPVTPSPYNSRPQSPALRNSPYMELFPQMPTHITSATPPQGYPQHMMMATPPRMSGGGGGGGGDHAAYQQMMMATPPPRMGDPSAYPQMMATPPRMGDPSAYPQMVNPQMVNPQIVNPQMVNPYMQTQGHLPQAHMMSRSNSQSGPFLQTGPTAFMQPDHHNQKDGGQPSRSSSPFMAHLPSENLRPSSPYQKFSAIGGGDSSTMTSPTSSRPAAPASFVSIMRDDVTVSVSNPGMSYAQVLPPSAASSELAAQPVMHVGSRRRRDK